MFGKISFLGLLVICCAISTATAQACIPSPVANVQLADSTLSWSASENCNGTQYIIYIATDGIVNYEYTVDVLNLDVSFLTLCRAYNFTVVPSANHILGMESRVQSVIPLDPSVDIIATDLRGDQIEDNVLIFWNVSEAYKYCVSYYHVLVWDEDRANPTALFALQNSYYLEHVAQCMNYLFRVTIYYNARNGTPSDFNFTVPAATNFPELVEIRQNAININTTWSLEKFRVNRCNVTALYVRGNQIDETYSIEDTADRPDVRVSINGLRANTMYYFNVSTENTAGVSRAYQMAVQTLPLDPTLD